MSAVAARYTRPSPRSAECPTAFTWGEFFRGAFAAWIGFNLLAPFAMIIVNVIISSIRGSELDSTFIPIIFIYVPMTAAPWSLGVLLLLGMPMAFMLGTAMRRGPYSAAHLWAFAGLGAFVGTVGIVAWQWWMRWPAPGVTINYMVVRSPWEELDWMLIIAMAATTAAAACFGWRFTMKRALLADAVLPDSPYRAQSFWEDPD